MPAPTGLLVDLDETGVMGETGCKLVLIWTVVASGRPVCS